MMNTSIPILKEEKSWHYPTRLDFSWMEDMGWSWGNGMHRLEKEKMLSFRNPTTTCLSTLIPLIPKVPFLWDTSNLDNMRGICEWEGRTKCSRVTSQQTKVLGTNYFYQYFKYAQATTHHKFFHPGLESDISDHGFFIFRDHFKTKLCSMQHNSLVVS